MVFNSQFQDLRLWVSEKKLAEVSWNPFCFDNHFNFFLSSILLSPPNTVKLTLFLDVTVLREVPREYVFDLGVEILDTEDKRYSDEVEVRPVEATIASGVLIESGMTVGELLDEIDDQDFVCFFSFFFSFLSILSFSDHIF